MAKDDLACGQGSSVCDCKKPTSSPIQYCVWEESIQIPSKHGRRFMNSRQHRELDRIDGEPTEFEWNIFPRFTTLQILAENLFMVTEIKCEPEQFQGRIVFMLMFHDIYGKKKETEKTVLRILLLLQVMLENSLKDILRFLGLDQKRSRTDLTKTNLMENGTMSLML